MLHFITQILIELSMRYPERLEGVENAAPKDLNIEVASTPERKPDIYHDVRSEDYLLEKWPDEY